MIKFKDIEQKTDEWFKMKWGKIGGTASNGLFVKSDTLKIDILSQRWEDWVPTFQFESDAMIRGNEMEPKARKWLEERFNISFEQVGWLQSEENELLGMSPDGLTADETIQCEIKCPDRKKHYETMLGDSIPSDYIKQCLHAFTVNPKLKELHFLSFRPEAPSHFLRTITLDTELDLGLKEKVEIPQFGVKGQPIKPKIKSEPIIKTVREWRLHALELADELLKELQEHEVEYIF